MDWDTFLSAVESALTTDLAFHIYAIAGAAILLAACALLARRELRSVRMLSPNDFTRSYPGKEPWSCDGLKKRIDALSAYRKAKLWTAIRHVGTLALLGFVVPSLILGAAVIKYSWLFGDQSPFVVSGDVSRPLTMGETVIFILSQFVQSISDFLEVFHIDIGHISVAHGQYVAEAGILSYRLFVGAFAFAIVYAVYVLVRVGASTDRKIDRLKGRLDDLNKFGRCD